MPANLTPEYKEAEKAYREAKTSEDKLRCLEYMLSVIPKHKGTDKLQGDLKKKIARLNREGDKKSGGSSRRGSLFNVSREGAGQIVLAGAPNSGKSALLKHMTKATPEVANYPYTTVKPNPGMLRYENINIQLVDLPPIGRDFTESWVPGIVRNADIALLTVNLASDEVLEETEFVIERLLKGKVELVEKVTTRYKPDGSAQVKTRILCTHFDHPDAEDVLELVNEVFADQFSIWTVSVNDRELLDLTAQRIFDTLRIIRIYTKSPGKDPDKKDPITLPVGSTLMDFAYSIHKDFKKNLKFARIWGSAKFDGQKVTRDYELQDEDIVELHT
jgi:ribosome-interacting GTPase 1